MVRGHVDRTSPGAFDARIREAGKQSAETALRTGRGRAVPGEAIVEPSAEADGTGPAAHQDAAVVRRAEVVEEHASVDDRLPARPADPLDELRDGLGEDDI